MSQSRLTALKRPLPLTRPPANAYRGGWVDTFRGTVLTQLLHSFNQQGSSSGWTYIDYAAGPDKWDISHSVRRQWGINPVFDYGRAMSVLRHKDERLFMGHPFLGMMRRVREVNSELQEEVHQHAGKHLHPFMRDGPNATVSKLQPGFKYLPGTAALIKPLMRPQDRAILVEKDPEYFYRLAKYVGKDHRFKLWNLDVYEEAMLDENGEVVPVSIPQKIKRAEKIMEQYLEEVRKETQAQKEAAEKSVTEEVGEWQDPKKRERKRRTPAEELERIRKEAAERVAKGLPASNPAHIQFEKELEEHAKQANEILQFLGLRPTPSVTEGEPHLPAIHVKPLPELDLEPTRPLASDEEKALAKQIKLLNQRIAEEELKAALRLQGVNPDALGCPIRELQHLSKEELSERIQAAMDDTTADSADRLNLQGQITSLERAIFELEVSEERDPAIQEKWEQLQEQLQDETSLREFFKRKGLPTSNPINRYQDNDREWVQKEEDTFEHDIHANAVAWAKQAKLKDEPEYFQKQLTKFMTPEQRIEWANRREEQAANWVSQYAGELVARDGFQCDLPETMRTYEEFIGMLYQQEQAKDAKIAEMRAELKRLQKKQERVRNELQSKGALRMDEQLRLADLKALRERVVAGDAHALQQVATMQSEAARRVSTKAADLYFSEGTVDPEVVALTGKSVAEVRRSFLPEHLQPLDEHDALLESEQKMAQRLLNERDRRFLFDHLTEGKQLEGLELAQMQSLVACLVPAHDKHLVEKWKLPVKRQYELNKLWESISAEAKALANVLENKKNGMEREELEMQLEIETRQAELERDVRAALLTVKQMEVEAELRETTAKAGVAQSEKMLEKQSLSAEERKQLQLQRVLYKVQLNGVAAMRQEAADARASLEQGLASAQQEYRSFAQELQQLIDGDFTQQLEESDKKIRGDKSLSEEKRTQELKRIEEVRASFQQSQAEAKKQVDLLASTTSRQQSLQTPAPGQSLTAEEQAVLDAYERDLAEKQAKHDAKVEAQFDFIRDQLKDEDLKEAEEELQEESVMRADADSFRLEAAQKGGYDFVPAPLRVNLPVVGKSGVERAEALLTHEEDPVEVDETPAVIELQAMQYLAQARLQEAEQIEALKAPMEDSDPTIVGDKSILAQTQKLEQLVKRAEVARLNDLLGTDVLSDPQLVHLVVPRVSPLDVLSQYRRGAVEDRSLTSIQRVVATLEQSGHTFEEINDAIEDVDDLREQEHEAALRASNRIIKERHADDPEMRLFLTLKADVDGNNADVDAEAEDGENQVEVASGSQQEVSAAEYYGMVEEAAAEIPTLGRSLAEEYAEHQLAEQYARRALRIGLLKRWTSGKQEELADVREEEDKQELSAKIEKRQQALEKLQKEHAELQKEEVRAAKKKELLAEFNAKSTADAIALADEQAKLSLPSDLAAAEALRAAEESQLDYPVEPIKWADQLVSSDKQERAQQLQQQIAQRKPLEFLDAHLSYLESVVADMHKHADLAPEHVAQRNQLVEQWKKQEAEEDAKVMKNLLKPIDDPESPTLAQLELTIYRRRAQGQDVTMLQPLREQRLEQEQEAAREEALRRLEPARVAEQQERVREEKRTPKLHLNATEKEEVVFQRKLNRYLDYVTERREARARDMEKLEERTTAEVLAEREAERAPEQQRRKSLLLTIEQVALQPLRARQAKIESEVKEGKVEAEAVKEELASIQKQLDMYEQPSVDQLRAELERLTDKADQLALERMSSVWLDPARDDYDSPILREEIAAKKAKRQAKNGEEQAAALSEDIPELDELEQRALKKKVNGYSPIEVAHAKKLAEQDKEWGVLPADDQSATQRSASTLHPLNFASAVARPLTAHAIVGIDIAESITEGFGVEGDIGGVEQLVTEATTKVVAESVHRFPHATYVITYPIFGRAYQDQLLQAVMKTGVRNIIQGTYHIQKGEPFDTASRVYDFEPWGAGVIVIRPPPGFEKTLKDIVGTMQEVMNSYGPSIHTQEEQEAVASRDFPPPDQQAQATFFVDQSIHWQDGWPNRPNVSWMTAQVEDHIKNIHSFRWEHFVPSYENPRSKRFELLAKARSDMESDLWNYSRGYRGDDESANRWMLLNNQIGSKAGSSAKKERMKKAKELAAKKAGVPVEEMSSTTHGKIGTKTGPPMPPQSALPAEHRYTQSSESTAIRSVDWGFVHAQQRALRRLADQEIAEKRDEKRAKVFDMLAKFQSSKIDVQQRIAEEKKEELERIAQAKKEGTYVEEEGAKEEEKKQRKRPLLRQMAKMHEWQLFQQRFDLYNTSRLKPKYK